MARPRGIKQRHPLGSVAHSATSRTGMSQLTVVAVSSASTGVKISELPAALAASDTDQMEVNQGGVSKRLTLDQVAALTPPPDLSAYLPLAGGTMTGDLTVEDDNAIKWSDIGLSRKAAGIVAVGNGTAGDNTGTLEANRGVFAHYVTVGQYATVGSIGLNYVNTSTLSLNNAVSWPFTSPDTGLSRISAGTVAVGNGTAGNASGTLNAANVTLNPSSLTIGNLGGATGPGLFGDSSTNIALRGYAYGGGRGIHLQAQGGESYAQFLNTGASIFTSLAVSAALTGTTATFTGTVFAPGAQIQMVSTQTGASTTGTTVIPLDNTIPQIGEGDQYMTLSVTPKSATSNLIIEVVWFGANSVANTVTVALFQDATANALAAASTSIAAGAVVTIPLRHTMTSGTTSATTFRVRAGGYSAGTTTFNANLYGGVAASSIVIREVAT